MRLKQLKTLLMLSLSFLILALFIKPYHAHTCSHSKESVTVTEHHHSEVETHHADHEKSHCGNECACPQHRVNGCSPFTALAKSDRILLLEEISSVHSEALFSAKQSPILDGPFQPPRA